MGAEVMRFEASEGGINAGSVYRYTPIDATVTIGVYDLGGRLVHTLVAAAHERAGARSDERRPGSDQRPRSGKKPGRLVPMDSTAGLMAW